jgi:hypothetical protein
MGKYDNITGRTVDKIWHFIHSVNEEGETDILYKFNKVNKRQLKFKLKVDIAVKTKGITEPFLIDGAAAPSLKLPTVEISVLLDSGAGKEYYNKLNACLNEVVRHELEHLTQSGINKRGRKAHVSESRRTRVSERLKPAYGYFSLPDEIPALVHGMHRQAKIEKRPITNIFIEYLKQYISEGQINERHAKLLFDKWYNYSIKNIPRAKYAESQYR